MAFTPTPMPTHTTHTHTHTHTHTRTHCTSGHACRHNRGSRCVELEFLRARRDRIFGCQRIRGYWRAVVGAHWRYERCRTQHPPEAGPLLRESARARERERVRERGGRAFAFRKRGRGREGDRSRGEEREIIMNDTPERWVQESRICDMVIFDIVICDMVAIGVTGTDGFTISDVMGAGTRGPQVFL